jgi:aerobic-type carbon monoxide dehydrogenase small subunit (CoxS/CutS family)
MEHDVITLTVNGSARHLVVDPETPLLWVLREQSHVFLLILDQ